MASTYSDLKIELIATGEQSGTWGATTNTNLGTAIEQAIVGKADVTVSSTSVTLTLTDSNALQDARALYLNLSGTPGGAATLNVPAIEKNYIVKNGTGEQVTIKVTGQTGVAIPDGKTALVYNNGTDVVTAVDYIPDLTARVIPRAVTTTSSATPTINTDNVDVFGLTAQAEDITSFSTNLSGTPTDGQRLLIYIVGTAARGITWGASFEASTVPLPTTTVSTNRLDVGFVWNAATSKWRCVAYA